MAQEFRINKNSTLPTLRMELIDDDTYNFLKSYEFNNAIQNADVTFTMVDENGNLKISKQPSIINKVENGTCVDKFIIEYKWKERDVNTSGKFKGWFDIKFNDDIYEEGVIYPKGVLRMPIHEELHIYVQ